MSNKTNVNSNSSSTVIEQTNTAFSNIAKALKNEFTDRRNEFLKRLNEFTEVQAIIKKWQYSDIMTKTTLKKDWSNDIAALKEYLIKRYDTKKEIELSKEYDRLNTIAAAPDLDSITISVQWTKSRMWGSNPNAMAEVRTATNFDRFESGSIGGYGYDKNSTAVANVVNQSNSFLKLLYTLKNKSPNTSKSNNDLFGYGSGYGIKPYLEGGVGVSCYDKICNSVGYEFKNIASGKMFDVYEIKKISKK